MMSHESVRTQLQRRAQIGKRLLRRARTSEQARHHGSSGSHSKSSFTLKQVHMHIISCDTCWTVSSRGLWKLIAKCFDLKKHSALPVMCDGPWPWHSSTCSHTFPICLQNIPIQESWLYFPLCIRGYKCSGWEPGHCYCLHFHPIKITPAIILVRQISILLCLGLIWALTPCWCFIVMKRKPCCTLAPCWRQICCYMQNVWEIMARKWCVYISKKKKKQLAKKISLYFHRTGTEMSYSFINKQ